LCSCAPLIHNAVSILFLGFVPEELPDIPMHLTLLLNDYDISPQILQFDLTHVEMEWLQLTSSIPEVWKLNNDRWEFQVSATMKARGLDVDYPAVLVLGTMSTVHALHILSVVGVCSC